MARLRPDTAYRIPSVIPRPGWPVWLWPVVGVAVGVLVSLMLVALAVLVWIRRRRGRNRRQPGERVRHRTSATDRDEEESKAWTQHVPERSAGSARGPRGTTDRNGVKQKKKKNKKGKEFGKKRREPLGEDAVRMKYDDN